MERPVLKETSAGGVVLRRVEDRYDICLILRTRHQRRAWCLPKGHLEPGEDAPTAAVREVLEETGLSCEVLEPLGTIQYEFEVPEQHTRCAKTVSYFLMRAKGGTPSPRDREAVEARWMSVEDATARAAYDNERRILARALEQLSRPEIAARLGEA